MTERDKLIENNTGLVHACAKRFAGRGVEYEELYSCGCIGLIKAADNFDSERGFRFSTYAVPVIMGEMKRIFRDGGTVKVSRSLKELSLKVQRASEEFRHRMGREPALSELSQILNISVEQAGEALSAAQIPLSLSGENDENGRELEIPVGSQEEAITERISLHQAIGSLPDADRQLITLRYFSQKTQTQTAQSLGMTQVQVSRREKKILTLLREKMTV